MDDRDVRQYAVRANKARYLPTRIVYFDSETKVRKVGKTEQHRLKLAWSCYHRKRTDGKADQVDWRYWEDTLDLCVYLESLTMVKSVLYIFGHNVFFDLQASDFYYYFTKWGWRLRFVYDKGLTYILTISKNKKTIKCLSSTNYFPSSLKNLGELVGLPKLDVDFKKVSRKELSVYCRRDVEILKKVMESWFDFISIHDLGKFGLTKASQAFNSFRHRFKPHGLCFHRDEELTGFELSAYFGGRTECFFFGKAEGGPFLSLDINSMYPYVMKTRNYPLRFVFFNNDPSLERVKRLLTQYCIIAYIRVRTKDPAYAVRTRDGTVFPIGEFDCYVCSEGLDYAIKHKHLREIYQIACYKRGDLFSPYVNYFYPLKKKYSQEKNPCMREITKHLLNNLYGKFAQRKPITVEETDITYDGYWREEIYDLTTSKVITVTKLFNKRYITEGSKPGKNSMTAVSAHVTEYARFLLWSIIKQVGRSRVLYCDTDSIKIRKRDLSRVKYEIHDYNLGSLCIEGESKELNIEGLKQYNTEHERKLKGVPTRAKQTGPYEYEYLTFTGQSTHLREKVDRYFIARKTNKTVNPTYKKGRVLKNGKVLPIVFGTA